MSAPGACRIIFQSVRMCDTLACTTIVMYERPRLGGYAHVSMMAGVRPTGLRREAARVTVGV
jgi:hypothetical protein